MVKEKINSEEMWFIYSPTLLLLGALSAEKNS